MNAAVGDVDQTYAKKKARECLLNNWKRPVQEHAGEKIIEALVKGGADLNQKNTKGIRAYDAAVDLGKRNFPSKRKNTYSNRKNPLPGDERMKAFLLKHGAKSGKQQ